MKLMDRLANELGIVVACLFLAVSIYLLFKISGAFPTATFKEIYVLCYSAHLVLWFHSKMES